MDKQIGEVNEMVEEMAKVIEEAMAKARRTLGGHNNIAMFYATMLINAGYRKIPEGAVVLMGMETEQQFEDLMVAFDEMGFMPYTTHPFPEEYVETWKQRLIFAFGQLRKETAEKFAEQTPEKVKKFLEEAIEENDYTREKAGLIEFTVAVARHIANEICKEITEGKE